MASIVEGIARELGAQVAGLDYSLTSGGNVFEEDFASEPDVAAAVYSAGGPEGQLGMPSNQHNLQIVFRADPENATTATDLWRLAYAHLHGLKRKALPDGTYLVWALVVQRTPVRIGADENGRQRFAMNVRCEVRE